MSKKTSVIIFAAGKGTRMKSAISKLLHKIGNLEIINYVLRTSKQLNCEEMVVVVSPENRDEIEKNIDGDRGIKTVAQQERLGTGHATKIGLSEIKNKDNNILVIFGDTPMIKLDTYQKVIETINTTDNAVVILGFNTADINNKYGRLKIDDKGELLKIIEYKEATEEEKKINLCNAGIMAIKGKYLGDFLEKIDNNNNAKEYYLVDAVQIARNNGLKCTYIGVEEDEVTGINSREELARAEKIFQNNRRKEFMTKGVSLIDPNSVYFSYDTEIENDVVIEPNVVFMPGVKIKSGATVKAFSYLEGCVLENGVSVGPFARIRPDTVLGENSKIGNFVEIKKSTIGNGVKIGHLTYIGDAEIGENTNIGCGTITCNYDGYTKSKTKIGKDNFIGSNTIFIAPIETGNNCLTAAGSVITKDIKENDMAVSRSEQKNISDGMKKYRGKREG
jgi:bifunctional UDP-N-acetylglucosamine pyrophosphorylase/glucosamine-1-phosphate N-acetyltransferase